MFRAGADTATIPHSSKPRTLAVKFIEHFRSKVIFNNPKYESSRIVGQIFTGG